jgi:hypothetical protein
MALLVSALISRLVGTGADSRAGAGTATGAGVRKLSQRVFAAVVFWWKQFVCISFSVSSRGAVSLPL